MVRQLPVVNESFNLLFHDLCRNVSESWPAVSISRDMKEGEENNCQIAAKIPIYRSDCDICWGNINRTL